LFVFFQDKRENMSQHYQEAVYNHLAYVEKRVEKLDTQINVMDKQTNDLTR